MKIHDFPFAPNPRKVRTYLGEKGLEMEFETVNLIQGDQRSERFLAMNPMGNTPVLELDDGSFLAESLAIIDYLEELHPEPPMWGDTLIERARARRLERIADLGVQGRVSRYVHAVGSPLPGKEPDPAQAAQMLEELPLPLGILDAELRGRTFLAGDRPTVGDCTLFAACEFGRFRELEIERGYPEIERWYAAFRERPSTKMG
jgi:glutathione S-transferase